MVRLYFARFGGELNLCNGVFLVVGIWNDAVGGCSRSQNGGVHMWSESKTRSGLPRKRMQRCCDGGLGLDLQRSTWNKLCSVRLLNC
jgi:hypothetical protein